MRLFKRKKIIDMTGRKLNVPKPSGKVNAYESGYKDLTSSSNPDNGSVLGFLGNMANSASNSSGSSYGSELSKSSPKHLKVKIEDIEYKVDSLRKKIDAVLDRLDLAEKKISRFEGR